VEEVLKEVEVDGNGTVCVEVLEVPVKIILTRPYMSALGVPPEPGL